MTDAAAFEEYRKQVPGNPGPDPTAVYGWKSRSRLTRLLAEAVAPLALPAVRLSVGELLP